MEPPGEGVATPSAPFERWSIHVFHPDYGFAWYCTQGRALITQTTVTHGRAAGARVLSNWIDTALQEDEKDIEAAGGLFLFHDFRSLKRYDPDTRSVIDERIRLRKAGYSRRTIMVVHLTPIWQMAMKVTDLARAAVRVPPAKVTGDMRRAAAELSSFVIDPVPPRWLVARPRTSTK